MSNTEVTIADDELRYYVNKLITDSNRHYEIENALFYPFKQYFLRKLGNEIARDKNIIKAALCKESVTQY